MRFLCVIVAASLCLGTQCVRATTTYSYVAHLQQGDWNVNYGGTNTVNLYLQEVSSAGSFTAASDGGLLEAGVAFVEQGGTGVSLLSVSGNSASEPSGFSGLAAAHSLNSGVGVWIQDLTASGATQGAAPVSTTTFNGTSTSLYLLGSVTMAVSANPSAWFKVESLYNAPPGQGVSGAGTDAHTLTFGSVVGPYDLDGTHQSLSLPPGMSANDAADSNPTYFVDFAIVPEPGSLAVFGLGAVALLARRKRHA